MHAKVSVLDAAERLASHSEPFILQDMKIYQDLGVKRKIPALNRN